jgi:CRISPR system Cascade subunit CasE
MIWSHRPEPLWGIPLPTLTRIALGNHPDVHADNHDLHATHRRLAAIANGWPPEPRLLWARPSPRMLLVQAPRPIPAGALPDGYALDIEHVDLTPTVAALTRGQPVTIRTVVNPVYRQDGATTRRYDESERPGWLAGLLTPALTVHHVTGRFLGFREGRKPSVETPIVYAWWSAVVDATVSDPDLLRRHIVDGVGRGRAFGCGLLDITVGAVPTVPEPDVRCPACNAAMPVGMLPAQCARCHVGVDTYGTLVGFTGAAVRWWRDRTFTCCISKAGFRSEQAARNDLEAKERLRPYQPGRGAPGVWHCPICDRWHWGHSKLGDPQTGPMMPDVLRGFALRERAQRWNQAPAGPNGHPRSGKDQRRAEAKAAR